MRSKRSDPLLDFRLSDALTFFSVRRHASLSAAARELGVTASQVSKAITRLEKQLNVTLLTRGSSGVEPSTEALRVIPLLEEVAARLRDARRTRAPETAVLALAGPSYVIGGVSSAVARALPEMRIRVMQLAPAAIRGSAGDNIFDAAFVVGEKLALESWVSEPVGELLHSLFAPPVVAARMGPQPVDVERVRRERFVLPTNHTGGKFVTLDDGCPLPPAERLAGHEAQTLALALDLAIAGEQVVFGPVAAALGRVMAGQLVPIAVNGWSSSETLHVLMNVDRISSRVRRTLLDEGRRFVTQMRPDSRPSLQRPAK